MSSDVHVPRPSDRSTRLLESSPDALEAFAHPRRSTALSVLRERERPLSVSELATEIVARETAVRPPSVDERERTAVCVSLHHAHLPKLADCGAVEWDRASRDVSIADDARRWVASVLESELADPACCQALANPRRRSVLAALLEFDEPVSTTVLAGAVGAHERDDAGAVTPAARERIAVSLHHADLPLLETAGLLEYDHEAKRVDPSTMASVVSR
ncbi:DUF7344 domain-containing protein [Natrononativus amylolyticus]|uniref:DUF7344 domain-containing protein n=1 Tax=Natrononativus amylolyticus TaxID=2963434 RepID=UPI0020CBAE89|nr:hypothetical protein [Natrononativus amylolyticus]